MASWYYKKNFSKNQYHVLQRLLLWYETLQFVGSNLGSMFEEAVSVRIILNPLKGECNQKPKKKKIENILKKIFFSDTLESEINKVVQMKSSLRSFTASENKQDKICLKIPASAAFEASNGLCRQNLKRVWKRNSKPRAEIIFSATLFPLLSTGFRQQSNRWRPGPGRKARSFGLSEQTFKHSNWASFLYGTSSAS